MEPCSQSDKDIKSDSTQPEPQEGAEKRATREWLTSVLVVAERSLKRAMPDSPLDRTEVKSQHQLGKETEKETKTRKETMKDNRKQPLMKKETTEKVVFT